MAAFSWPCHMSNWLSDSASAYTDIRPRSVSSSRPCNMAPFLYDCSGYTTYCSSGWKRRILSTMTNQITTATTWRPIQKTSMRFQTSEK